MKSDPICKQDRKKRKEKKRRAPSNQSNDRPRTCPSALLSSFLPLHTHSTQKAQKEKRKEKRKKRKDRSINQNASFVTSQPHLIFLSFFLPPIESSASGQICEYVGKRSPHLSLSLSHIKPDIHSSIQDIYLLTPTIVDDVRGTCGTQLP